jgi:hypothetical protein
VKTKCPLDIKNPNHFKKDGSCLCFDHPAIEQTEHPEDKQIYRWKKHNIIVNRKYFRKLKAETP